MRKTLTSSLLAAEIAAFAMLLLLFLINTSKPYLLLLPVAEAVAGFFAFHELGRKMKGKGIGKTILFMTALTVLLGIIIAASVIGLVYALRVQ